MDDDDDDDDGIILNILNTHQHLLMHDKKNGRRCGVACMHVKNRIKININLL